MKHATQDNHGADAVARRRARVPGVAAAGALLLRAAPASAGARRGVRAVADSMPRAAPDRAGTARADAAAGGSAGLRRVERHRTGGPPRIARPGAAPGVGGG